MVTLTNAEHAQLADWADEICERRRPQGTPRCPFCLLWRGRDETLAYRHGNIHKNPIAWGQNRKCPNCFVIESFGLPMTREEYDRTYELQGDSRHYNGKPTADTPEGELPERLAALGYLDWE